MTDERLHVYGSFLEGKARQGTVLPPSEGILLPGRKSAIPNFSPKYTHLLRTVENKLGIMRMVTIRHIQPPRPGRGRRRKPREKPMNPLISRVSHAGFLATADPVRTTAFWDAVRRILGEDNPDEETKRLQSDIRAWLNAPLEARRNRRR